MTYTKMTREIITQQYNQVLDLSRDGWVERKDIVKKTGIIPQRINAMFTRLMDRKLIIRERIDEGNIGKGYRYKAVEGAIYTSGYTGYQGKKGDNKKEHYNSIAFLEYTPENIANGFNNTGIVKKGNVTMVSSNGYHSTGNKSKTQVWLASTLG